MHCSLHHSRACDGKCFFASSQPSLAVYASSRCTPLRSERSGSLKGRTPKRSSKVTTASDHQSTAQLYPFLRKTSGAAATVSTNAAQVASTKLTSIGHRSGKPEHGRIIVEASGNVEVAEMHMTLRVEEDVVGLDVPVDNPSPVKPRHNTRQLRMPDAYDGLREPPRVSELKLQIATKHQVENEVTHLQSQSVRVLQAMFELLTSSSWKA